MGGPPFGPGGPVADALLWRGGECLWVGGGDKDMDVVKVIGSERFGCFLRGIWRVAWMLLVGKRESPGCKSCVDAREPPRSSWIDG